MDLLQKMFRARNYTPISIGERQLMSGGTIALLTDSVSKKSLQSLLSCIPGQFDAIIIVATCNKMPATLTRRALEMEYNIEFFTEAELRLNAVFHRNMPTYTLLDEASVASLEQQKKIPRRALPVLLPTDPITRYYGFKIGSVVQIEHQDRVWYRIVQDVP